MKFLIIAASLALSSAAMATPIVGDSATYDATVTVPAGQTYTGTIVMAIAEFNSTTTQYRTTETVTASGQTQSSEKWVDAKELLTDTQISEMMSACGAEGSKVDVVTVAGNPINTCAISITGETTGTVWIGQVPFGVVKRDITSAQGNHLIATLSSFTVGH